MGGGAVGGGRCRVFRHCELRRRGAPQFDRLIDRCFADEPTATLAFEAGAIAFTYASGDVAVIAATFTPRRDDGSLCSECSDDGVDLTAARGRLPVIVQVGHNSFVEAHALAAHAQIVGADAIAATPPTCSRPIGPDGLVEVMASVATSRLLST